MHNPMDRFLAWLRGIFSSKADHNEQIEKLDMQREEPKIAKKLPKEPKLPNQSAVMVNSGLQHPIALNNLLNKSSDKKR